MIKIYVNGKERDANYLKTCLELIQKDNLDFS